jgi:leucyl aminopeptidase
MLAGFSVDQYKTGERFGPPAASWRSSRTARRRDAALERRVERGTILGESSNLARGFANEPSNVLTPRVFAERARRSRERRRRVEILDEKEIERSAWGCCSASRAAASSRRA